MLLVPVYFVIVSAIFVNKLLNRTFVSVVTTSTVLTVLHLNAGELTREKKAGMGGNLQPKNCANR